MIRKIFIFPIRIYQIFISPWLPAHCRFFPTCSEYTVDAIKKHGVIKGIFYGTRRILRCHPLGGSGWDPVPLRRSGIQGEKELKNKQQDQS